MLNIRLLHESDICKVFERHSPGGRTDWGGELGGYPPSVSFIRRGVFACRAARDLVISEPLNVKFYDGDHGFQYRQLADGSVDSTLIQPGVQLLEEGFQDFGYQIAIPNHIHLQHVRLHRRLKSGALKGLAADEAVMDLLNAVSGLGDGRKGPIHVSAAVRRRLDDARAYIAAEPEIDHKLSDVARIAGCSPFHFARLFKAETGHSLRAYRLRLRTALAVAGISDGARNLSALALDTGFSHHSHMTAAFRTILHAPPSAVRESLFSATTH